MMMKKTKPILYDPLIIPRVKQYLEENVHQTYVDVSVMAKKLQERYREYSRRKTAPFRLLVEQAYKTVLHSYGLDSNPSSEDNVDANSDLEVMDENSVSNHMNDMLTTLYTKQTNKSGSNRENSGDNELIDISSDESGDEKTKDKNEINKKCAMDAINSLKNVSVQKISKNNGNSDAEKPINSKRDIVASFGPDSVTQVLKKRKVEQARQEMAKVPPLTPAGPLPLLKARKYKKEINITHSNFTFRDVGGMEKILKELCELLLHIKHPQIYLQIGIPPPRGFLLHGPPGCGKTLLAQAIAGQLNIALIEVPATELIAGVSGESEERIREVFEQAVGIAPCVLFIDEIDAISANRMNAQRDMERRIVAQLISSLDNLSKTENGEQVVVVGATNRPECLDPALRRVGRFDHEISIGIPDRDEREEILIVICENLSLEYPFEFRTIAELTPGYVGADLLALASRAASIAIRRCFQRSYRLQQAKMAKFIPVVNLVDEALAEPDESQKQTKVDDKTSTNEKINGITNEANVVDTEKEVSIIESTDLNKTTDKENQQDKISEPNAEGKPAEEKESNENQTAVQENTNNNDVSTEKEIENVEIKEKEDETPEEIEKMDVDKSISDIQENVVKTVNPESTNKPDEMNETIDVDEIPEKPEQILQKFSRKNVDLSLFEMLTWLNSETPPIRDSHLEDLFVTLDDFKEAIKVIQPSAKREGFITVPNVTWDDVGSLQDIREELKLSILAPVKYPEKLKQLGLNSPSGVLLCGPPGCGKTLLAKAVANEAGINFISVKGPELMNMYVGESERAVRQCFQRARNSTPCVIFFDEFDSLCPKRSDSNESGSGTRVVNQLLTEMDGIEERKGVFLMAATNRPDIIDPAILRPGRLDTILYVDLPEHKDRTEILEALTKKGTEPPLASDVDLSEISEIADGFTGADLSGLIRQAALLALKDFITDDSPTKTNDIQVTKNHLMKAFKLTKPSVSQEDRKIYEKLRLKYATPRTNTVTT